MFLHFFTQHLLRFLQSVSKHTLIAYTFQSWYLSFAKPLVLGPKTMGFRLWNPWFYNMKPMLSECNFMGFGKRSQYCINIQKRKPHPRAALRTAPPPTPPRRRGEWIPLLPAGGRGTEATVLLWFAMLTIVEQGLRALFSSTQINSPTLFSPLERGVTHS